MITRRDLLKSLAACGLLAAAAPLLSRMAQAQGASTSARFDQRETQIIRDYYRMEVAKARANRGKGGGVPAGLPRKDELPPGLMRMIREGQPLPSAVPKKSLPAELEKSLPVRPTSLRLIAGDLVMLVDGKGTVRDILAITEIIEPLYR